MLIIVDYRNHLSTAVKLLFLLVFSSSAFATFTDITGSYSGTFSGQDISCTDTSDNGPFSGTLSISLIGSTNGVISGGSGVFINQDGEVSNLKINSGTNDNTNFSFNFSEANGDFTSASVTGTFTATSVIITSGSGGPESGGCFFINLQGTLTRTSGTTTVSVATPSSTLTEAVLFNSQIQSAVNNISTRINGTLRSMRSSFRPSFTDNQFKMEGAVGINAGDGNGIPYGVWGNYAYTDYENDLSSTAFDGNSHGFLGGIDFGVFENTVIGIAIGYESSDIDTTFNGGNQDTDSFTIAPYFGALLDDILSVDFNIGYTRVEYDQYRTAGTTRVTSSPEADRWFGAFNLNATKYLDHWILGGRVGMLYASSTIDSYSESNNAQVDKSKTKLGTVSVGGDVAYSYGDFEPFLNLAYQYDFNLQEITVLTGPQPSNDNDDILMTAGIRYFEKSGISGNLEYSKRFLRDDFDEDRVSITVRIDF